MTVSTATATATLAWTGVETTFNAGFQAQNVGDVSVTFVAPGGKQTLLTLGAHYALMLDGSGNVTATPIALPAARGNLLILRNSSLVQPDSFVDGEPSRTAATYPARASELRAADAVHAAAGAGDDLAGKQQADHARATYANFFAELLLLAYRMVRSAPAVARGEGGFVSKEIVSGAYKMVGAAMVAGAVRYGPDAAYLAPQALDFVLRNLDQLQAFCAVAFEHAPGAAPLLRWLEANAARKPSGEQR